MKVYKNINDNYPYIITENSNFKFANVCDAHDKDGKRIGCIQAGCDLKNDKHTKEQYLNFFYQTTMETIFLNSKRNNVLSVREISKEKEKEILDDLENSLIIIADDDLEIYRGENYMFYRNSQPEFKPWVRLYVREINNNNNKQKKGDLL